VNAGAVLSGCGAFSSNTASDASNTASDTADVYGVATPPACPATPPVANPTQSPTANAAGWNSSDVTVTWNWVGTSGAGIDAQNCTSSSTSSGEGTLTLTATCKDLVGNLGNASYSVKVDKTAPTISAAPTTEPNASGWYNGNVTVHFTCSDTLSGIPAGTCPADQLLSAEGNAVSSTARTVKDAAGNTSASSNVATVAIDKSAPVVSVTGVSNGATYPLGNVPAPGCATTDALSGVAVQATLQVTGGTPNGVGAITATCGGATDRAGNTTPAVSATYTVNYTFGGYVAPVNNPPTVNTGKSGRAYPVKFQLTNASGSFISALSAVKSISFQSTGCAAFSSDPTDPLETSTTGNSGLRYDSTANQYVYAWATPSAPGCYTLVLTLDSGQVLPAYFSLS
jgi:hypothetical protein